MKIVVTRRTADVHACIEGEPEIWDRGLNYAEALGNLLMSHRNRFGVEGIEFPVVEGAVSRKEPAKETAVI